MSKKLEIVLNGNDVSIQSELEGHELYQAYCAIAAHIAVRLKNKEDIVEMSKQAGKNALAMINQKIKNVN